MMCSIEELGSSREMYPDAPESGIYILPDDCEVGADAVEILGLRDVVSMKSHPTAWTATALSGICQEAGAYI